MQEQIKCNEEYWDIWITLKTLALIIIITIIGADQ